MHSLYRIGRYAWASVSKYRNKIYTLESIYVEEEHRGKRYGAALMKRILEDADKHCVVMRLLVAPQGEMKYDALVAWYERLGFVEYSLLVYMRLPKGQANDVYTLRNNASQNNISRVYGFESADRTDVE